MKQPRCFWQPFCPRPPHNSNERVADVSVGPPGFGGSVPVVISSFRMGEEQMASSTCVKCGHTSFEVVESAISGLRFKRDFLQCGNCGGVIGVIESDNLNGRLDAIEARLKHLAGSPRARAL